MKTRKWVFVIVGVLVTLGLIIGAGFDGAGWFSSSAASAESPSDEGSTAVEVPWNDPEYRGFELEPENINQILREYEALRESQLKDAENQRSESEPANANQTSGEAEALNETQEEEDRSKDTIELESDLLQRQMRFNLPEA